MNDRALIYCRVSKDQRHGRSVAQQESECRAVCATESWEVVEVVTDNDVGASRHSKGRRRGWERVQARLRTGEIDVLVTWEGSRAQRDLDRFVELRRLCVDQGVRWHYGGRTYDMTVSRDRRDTARDAVDAEGESDMTSERIKRDKRAAAVAGRPTGRRLYGYRRMYDPTSGELVGQEPHPDEAPIVRAIFADYLTGTSMRTLVRQLNDNGARTSTGKRWNDAQVRRVLTNPAYVGKRVHLGQVIGDADWPALVEIHQWERVQARLSEGRGRNPASATSRLLTGVLRCGVCGGRMRCGKSTRNGARSYYCPSFHVARQLDALDAFVIVVVLERLVRPDVADALAGAPDPTVESARGRAQLLRDRLDDAIAEFTAGNLTAATLARIEADLGAQIADAERAARAALVPLDVHVPTVHVDDWWDALAPEQRRAIVGALIAAVVVKPVGRGHRTFDPDAIDIEWRR